MIPKSVCWHDPNKALSRSIHHPNSTTVEVYVSQTSIFTLWCLLLRSQNWQMFSQNWTPPQLKGLAVDTPDTQRTQCFYHVPASYCFSNICVQPSSNHIQDLQEDSERWRCSSLRTSTTNLHKGMVRSVLTILWSTNTVFVFVYEGLFLSWGLFLLTSEFTVANQSLKIPLRTGTYVLEKISNDRFVQWKSARTIWEAVLFEFWKGPMFDWSSDVAVRG